MREQNRRNILGLAIVAGAAMLAGTTPAWAEEVVNVYNARHYGTDQQLWRGFTEATGIEVRVVEGDHDALIQRLAAEGANSPADVFITVDAGRLALAAAQDLLQPVTSPTLEANIPAHLRHPEGLWHGLAVRARVITYAKDRVDPSVITAYEDLADERWRGKVLIRSSSNVYNLSLLGSIIEANGPEAAARWCEGLVANLARPPQGGDTDQINAVAAGVGDLAVNNTYYLARLIASEKPEDKAIAEQVGVIFPNQDGRGTHVNISGAGVTRHAPNSENALRFLEYLSSPEAQRYFADISLEYPANPEVKPHPVLAEWGEFEQDTLNAAAYAARSEEASRLADRCGWR
jgi:iron(III) transport system substrate-binding protein